MNYHSRKLLKLNLAPWRMAALGSLLLAGFTVVAGRALYLQGLNTDYLQGKGDAVANRNLTLPAQRGQVADRHGQLLAISTPVESLWARPTDLRLSSAQRAHLARVLDVSPLELEKKLARRTRGEFSVQRPVTPEQAAKVTAMGVPGRRSGRACGRLHQRGRPRAGGGGTRLPGLAGRPRRPASGPARPPRQYHP